LLLLGLGVSGFAQSQTTNARTGCTEIAGQLSADISSFGRGLGHAPRNAIRPNNLKWELPIMAGAGLLIAFADNPVNNRIHSPAFVQDSTRGSNVGIGLELGTAGLMYAVGCYGQRSSYVANTGWTALEAMGTTSLLVLGAKAMANREYAYHPNTHGEFWEGGKSFPSGHAAASFAFASVLAHRFPNNPWIKWGAYGLATGISLARVGGKKHFTSDILVGATIGYVSGTYLATHSDSSGW
jgi:hypothetical protein